MSLEQMENELGKGPKTYDLEDDTKRLLEEQRKRLMVPSTEELLGAVGTPGQGLLTPTPTYDYSVGLGGQSADTGARVTDALTKRNIANSTDYINNLKNNLKLSAPVRDAKNLRQVGQGYVNEVEVKLNNNKILKQYDLDKRRLAQYKQQQKDSILASVLGVVGAVAGAALGVVTGGAGFALTGAALGAMAGKKGGEMAGGPPPADNIA